MAAQRRKLKFTGKSEPDNLYIDADIKTENFEDSPSSGEEPGSSHAVIVDWDGMAMAGGDKANACASPLDDDDVEVSDLSCLDESPCQPILQKFPVSIIGGKPRRFTAHWYSKYLAWLEYSAEKDAIFCKVCRHFGNNLISDKFTRGFRNWKRTHQACSKHELSKAHNTALSKYMNYKTCHPSNRATIRNQTGNQSLTPGLSQSNRDHIRVMLDIVMFWVRQHLATAPCKPRDETDQGNIQELFQLLSKYDPRIKTRLDAIPKNKNSALIGPDIHNDLIDAAASLLLRQIKHELHNNKNTYYTILADECSDQTEHQLIALCLRYFYNGSIRERVVGFIETGDTLSADEIASKIFQTLEPFELDSSLCVGFGFDGSSILSGVHSILKCTYTRALYVHRRSHCLTSALCAASKACVDFKTFLQVVNAMRLFLAVDGSHGQARFLDIQKEMLPDQPPVELSCGTQTHLGISVTDVFHLFDIVLETLSDFAENGGQPGLEAQSLLQQVQTKKFAFLLVSSCKLTEVSDYVSKSLKSDNISASEFICSIDCLKQNLCDLQHGGFDPIMTASDELTGKNEIENWDVSFSRKRKLPGHDDPVLSATLGKSTRVRCADDLRAIWHQILDLQINELDCRFHHDSYCLMNAVDSLCTNDVSNLVEHLQPVCKSYSVEISDTELFTFSQILQVSAAGLCLPLIEVLDVCSEENFPNLHLILRILLTLPITSCPDERICSSVNKIKSASQSSMLTAQMNPLSLLAFEKDLTDTLDYDEIIDIFYFIKFIKPFLSSTGKVESVNQTVMWKPMIPI